MQNRTYKPTSPSPSARPDHQQNILYCLRSIQSGYAGVDLHSGKDYMKDCRGLQHSPVMYSLNSSIKLNSLRTRTSYVFQRDLTTTRGFLHAFLPDKLSSEVKDERFSSIQTFRPTETIVCGGIGGSKNVCTSDFAQKLEASDRGSSLNIEGQIERHRPLKYVQLWQCISHSTVQGKMASTLIFIAFPVMKLPYFPSRSLHPPYSQHDGNSWGPVS